jgi:WD40 repeat protein/serine/threonine protein kinase
VDIPSTASAPVIPEYELIRRIGRGSCGEVWLARTEIGRFRAVKVVYGELSGREYAGLKKYEPISRSHPGFVAILHVGRNQAEGYFYYVMELADDRDLGTEINPAIYRPRTLAADSKILGRLPVTQCVELGIALSEALHELHRHGLVHRDIKPSNIIFVNGAPKLADIGLIADVADAKSYVGTEGFISPEGPNSPQGDIYSLGKVLYEISTGNDRTDFPRLPTDLAEAKEKTFIEFNEVLVKACHADVRRRYRTAKEMQGDLTLLRSGESVRRLRRLEHFFRRTKQIGVAVGIGLPLLVLSYLQIDYRNKKAAEIRQLQLGGHLADGMHALTRGDYAGSLSPFLSAAMLDERDSRNSRAHRLRLRQVLDRCPKLVQVFFHGQAQVDQAEFSSSEEQILTATYWGKAQLWNTRTGLPVSSPFGNGKALESAALSPDGKYVAIADQNGFLEIWATATGLLLTNIVQFEGGLHSVRFSPNGNAFVTAEGRGLARVWEFPSCVPTAGLAQHTGNLTYAGYSRDGQYLLTTGRDMKAIVWEARTFAPVHRLPHKNWVHHGDFSPDGRLLVTGCFDRQARLWDLSTGQQLYPEMPHGDGVYTARFSPDGRYVVTACLDGIVRLWDVMTRQLTAINPMIRHGDRVLDARFSADGRRLLVACGDGTARIWDLAGGSAQAEGTEAFYAVNGSLVDVTKAGRLLTDLTLKSLCLPASNHVYPKHALTRNGRFVVELKRPATNQFEFRAWDLQTSRAASPAISMASAEHMSACASEDGRRGLAYGRKSAQIYDFRSGKPLHQVQPGLNIAGATFSPNNRYLIIYGSSTAAVWDVESGKMVFSIGDYESKVRYVEFSPDSRKFIVCTTSSALEKCFAEIWSLESKSRVGKPLQHGDGVLLAAFSRDARWLVTASEDFYATVWDTTSGEQMVPSLQHEHKVLCASFSHNGDWLTTASADARVQLWDSVTRKPLTPPLRIPEGTPASVRFVKDDTAVFVTTEEGGAWLWRLKLENRPLEQLAGLYEVVAGRGDFEANRFRTTPQERLKQAWLKFTRENPEDFEVTPAEIAAWQR